MASKRHERTLSRRQAVQTLYQSEILDIPSEQLLESEASFIDQVKPSEYAIKLVQGVNEHLDQIDAQIEATSENWAMDRMPTVDRAVLRLACFEMMFVDEVPVSVAINEAVDLAKEFGGEDESHKFVNGVLGRIAVMLENDDLVKVESAPTDDAQDEEAAKDAAPADTESAQDAAEEAQPAVTQENAE